MFGEANLCLEIKDGGFFHFGLPVILSLKFSIFVAQHGGWCLTQNIEAIGPVPDVLRGQESD